MGLKHDLFCRCYHVVNLVVWWRVYAFEHDQNNNLNMRQHQVSLTWDIHCCPRWWNCKL